MQESHPFFTSSRLWAVVKSGWQVARLSASILFNANSNQCHLPSWFRLFKAPCTEPIYVLSAVKLLSSPGAPVCVNSSCKELIIIVWFPCFHFSAERWCSNNYFSIYNNVYNAVFCVILRTLNSTTHRHVYPLNCSFFWHESGSR